MDYLAVHDRYDQMQYRRCGLSGIKLPVISLGLWHNFGDVDQFENGRKMMLQAFDAGITHFDLANNYGPPPGSAEKNFGQVISRELHRYRDELIISTKAGYLMWPGPYGEWGSRKYLLASLNQSLQRMKLDYVDIFYSHRYDPDTPLEETMGALDYAVKSGKALYAGISNYPPEQTIEASRILRQMGTPCLIHQVRFSMFATEARDELGKVLLKEGIGCIAFSPLAQGLLTNKYLNGIPADSRAGKPHGFLKKEQVSEAVVSQVKELNELAGELGLTLAELALNWVKSHPFITSVLIGASSSEQLSTNLRISSMPDLDPEIYRRIDTILTN